MKKGKQLTPGQQVLLRDTGIFMAKLWIDGMKDVVLAFMGIGAVAVDLVRGRGREGYLFYRVMRFGERIDLWLNLYGAVETAEHNEEGLFGASRAGEDSFLGRLEDLTGGERGPRGEDPRNPHSSPPR